MPIKRRANNLEHVVSLRFSENAVIKLCIQLAILN